MALLSKKCNECGLNRMTLSHCQKCQDSAVYSVGSCFILLNIFLLVIGLVYLFSFIGSHA